MLKPEKRKKILVIDDDRINRAIIAEILEENFDVIEAADIDTAYAIEENTKKHIDLILIDMFLKNSDFWKFMDGIKTRSDYAGIPVVVIIAPDTDNMFIERAGRLGAAEFVARPFSEYIINRRISKIIDISPEKSEHMQDRQNGESIRERTSAYLEEERAKSDFFLSQTREIWFKYNFDPQVITLSRMSADKLGVPQIVENPFENEKIKSFFDDGQYERIRNSLRDLSAENSFYEGEMQLNTEAGRKWYRLSMYIVWSAELNKPASVFGMFQDIDTGYRELEKLQRYEAPEAQLSAEALDCDIPEITEAQAVNIMKYFGRMFEFVRLVDPEICMQFTIDSDNHIIEKPYRCYAIWNKSNRCDNCISMTVAHTKKTLTKLEFINDRIYNVSAAYILVDGKGYVLELASFVDHDVMLSADDKNKLLNAITAHNRQLYIDSVTGIYNRRYYDDRLCELSGEFAFAMIDMDNFKQINDRFGHLAGDAALAAAAQAIKANVGTGDDVVRFGGDEFFVLFKDMPNEILQRKLEKILQAIERVRIEEYPELRVTVSIGGAYDRGKLSQILRKADIAMYNAKGRRNSICIYED